MSARTGLRVSFDARALDIDFVATQGIGRHVHSLLDPLASHAAERGGELVVLRARRRGVPAYGEPSVLTAERTLRRPPVPARAADLAEQLLLPIDVRRTRADAHHSPMLYRSAALYGLPSVVTVHDVIPLLFSDMYLRTGLMHRLLYRAARRADQVLTISAASAADITRRLGIPGERVTSVPLAADARFRPVADPGVARTVGVEGPYLLCVGGLAESDPRKNVEALIDGFARWAREHERPETLVFCGRLGAAGDPLVRRARESAARIHFTGFFCDEDLPELISGAVCLVMPSRYEGFGLPALEAISCGTPVAAFDVGAIPEAAGPGALLVADGDMPALLGAVERIAEDAELRARLAAAGVEHARRFSWERVARETWAVYERAVANT